MRGFLINHGWRAAILCLLAATPLQAQSEQVTALREGNRLFREDRLQESYLAYLEGFDESVPHPVLFYNLGTVAHRLNRLPEAVLWYRRAAAVNSGDPWLRENLETARATLGLQPYAAPGLSGLVALHSTKLYYLAALLAWAGTAWWMARSRHRLAPTLTLLAVALTVYGGALLASRWAPVPAVVTADCSSTDGDLPAGSEVWIVQRSSDETEIDAGGLRLTCPTDSVAAVTN